jgi:hypothetical protein
MSDLRGQTDNGGELYSDDVSRAYRLAAREEPSPALDDALHAAALRAAGSRPRLLTRVLPQRWGVPIAVAATIVVGVSVAFLAADRPEPALAPLAEAPVPQRPESRQATPGTPPASAEITAGERARELSRPAPGVGVEEAPVTAAARDVRPSRERTTRDQVVAKREQSALPSASSASPAPPGAPADASADQIQKRVPTTAALPDAARGLHKAPPGTDPQGDHDAELLSPEAWLQRIRELRSKGEMAQADESLRAFRRRYPDYPMPADVPWPAQGGK